MPILTASPVSSDMKAVHQKLPSEDLKDLSDRVARLERHCGLSVPVASSGEESGDYNRALSLLKKGEYKEASIAFRQFCQLYPHSSLLSVASYWLGVTFFVQGQYAEAAKEFDACLKKWPQNDKAFDTRLKLILCYQRLDRLDDARKELSSFRAVLQEHPSLDAAALERFSHQADALERSFEDGSEQDLPPERSFPENKVPEAYKGQSI